MVSIVGMAQNLPRAVTGGFIRVSSKSQKALKKFDKVDPRDRYVCIFPSSDHVFPGMGLDLLQCPPAEQVYERASEQLKFSVLNLCLGQSETDLKSSKEKRDIAAFVTSHAALTKLKLERPHDMDHCKNTAGVGVGFINSLVWAESMTFEHGLDLVQSQGRAMDKVAQIVPTSTIIVKMRPATSKHKVCKAVTEYCIRKQIPVEIATCSVIAQLRPQLVKIGAHEVGIQFLEQEGYRLFDFKSMKRDPNMGPAYHSKLMEPATQFITIYIRDKLRENPDYIKEPFGCSVSSGISGRRVRYKDAVIEDLSRYPSETIKTEQLMNNLFARDSHIGQPNTIVFWDQYLFKNLLKINRKAWSRASLLKV